MLADASNAASLDALNGRFYRDATSGLTIAEAGGGDQDEAGLIPASEDNDKCAVYVVKAYSRLLDSVYDCHERLARYAFAGRAFDEKACEGAQGCARPLRRDDQQGDREGHLRAVPGVERERPRRPAGRRSRSPERRDLSLPVIPPPHLA